MDDNIQVIKGKIVNFDGIKLQLPEDVRAVTNTAIGTNNATRMVVDFGVAATMGQGRVKYQRFGIIPKSYMDVLRKSGLGNPGQELYVEADFSTNTPLVKACYRIN